MAAKRQQYWPMYVALLLGLVLAAVPLPDWLAPFRPDWVALVMIYMAIHLPRHFVLTTALFMGLILDALYGTPLGQHALALVITCYLPLRWHLQLLLVPIWQSILTTVLFIAIYQFVLFWCNGAVGNDVGAGYYLWPLLSAVLVWPLLLAMLDTLRLGLSRKN